MHAFWSPSEHWYPARARARLRATQWRAHTLAADPQYHRWVGSLGGGTGSTTALMIRSGTIASGVEAGGATRPSGDAESGPGAGRELVGPRDRCSNPCPPWSPVVGVFIDGSIWRRGPLGSKIAGACAMDAQEWLAVHLSEHADGRANVSTTIPSFGWRQAAVHRAVFETHSARHSAARHVAPDSLLKCSISSASDAGQQSCRRYPASRPVPAPECNRPR